MNTTHFNCAFLANFEKIYMKMHPSNVYLAALESHGLEDFDIKMAFERGQENLFTLFDKLDRVLKEIIDSSALPIAVSHQNQSSRSLLPVSTLQLSLSRPSEKTERPPPPRVQSLLSSKGGE